MPEQHERMFYELMWRIEGRGRKVPLPWWVQQYFRRWSDEFDGGLFESKESAFSSNAHFRYWNMIGVKDAHQESLVGQAGEIEPVYDEYALSFFLFDPATRELHFPQFPEPVGGVGGLEQTLEDGYLPVVVTRYRSPLGIDVEEKALATTVGADQRSMALVRFTATLRGAAPAGAWLCVSVTPAGPTGFQRRDNAGRNLADRRIGRMEYVAAEKRVLINTTWGPVFDTAPAHFGTYGNGDSVDPNFYLTFNPYEDLRNAAVLNGRSIATDFIAGICQGVFAWPLALTAAAPAFTLDVRLPIDDYRGANDLADLTAPTAQTLENSNRAFWTNKLDADGLQASLPPRVAHLFALFRTCRANLLILADDGEIHPGPTVYDSFWIRDSSVEGIACALAGDTGLAQRQFGEHYPRVFHRDFEMEGPVSLHGFFGQEHERNDREWDANGQALWAFGKFDRIRGAAAGFGASVFSPYIIEGARWIRDNRSPFGLLHSGWSAEHIGDKDKPHFWDDFWALAGLWEAAQLSTRIGTPFTGELWNIYDQVRIATRDSIRWVLREQHNRGAWETYIPTGPGDVGRLDSTIIGAVAYFHPCRLYMGRKLGDDIDLAARLTLETIWSRFIDGGFRHDSAWFCYGPYLTLQLAHAFLLIGEVGRMDALLAWTVGNAGFAGVSRGSGLAGDRWQAVLGAWNEQHCYPIAKDFAEVPNRWWYMGDIPHGWACAEFNLLLRDILFFEADEDTAPHIFLAPGVMPHWLGEGESVEVSGAPTLFGALFGYRLTHHLAAREIEITITVPPPANVSYIFPCRFGAGVAAVIADGASLPVSGNDVSLPAGTTNARVKYL